VTRLLLVRHGVTGWNREGRFQGHLDPELSDEGRVEAELLADRMAGQPDERPGLIVTSSLVRAAQTAEVLAQRMASQGEPSELREDTRLIEVGQGDWEGRTHDEIAVTDAARYAAWRSEARQEPPGAEPLEQVEARVRSALAEALAGAHETICLVSHGGTLRIAIGELLGLDRLRAWAMDLDNCSISSLRRDGDGPWLLERWNDTGHLLGRTAQHVDEVEGKPLAL
jgi:broad specificity phosphatase PhoE